MKDSTLGIILWFSFCGGVIGSWNLGYKAASDLAENAANNSIENIEAIKLDCEKSLPRDQECVMVFDFVPVKKGENK